ncbi:MAG: LysM peptidoglycan-binding domain-containing protein [Anaerolineae bacterium]|nr:LysM peptidoglycan-binding domain-containing protein [Anaerolineae bacterium]
MQHTTRGQIAASILAALLFSFFLLPFTVWAQTETPEPPPEIPTTEPAIPFVHAIQEGENLTVIATNYGVTVEEILTANGLTPEALLSIGQSLIIPGRAGEAIPGLYTVQVGDSLSGLAEAYGITAVTLAQTNRTINPELNLIVGQTISITSHTGSTTPQTLTGTPHVVAPGETLWMIAAQNKLTPEALAAANGLAGETAVFPGQRLRIPSEEPYRALPGEWTDIRIRPFPIQPGSTFSVYVDNLLDGEPTGKFGEQNLHFAPYEDGYVALVGLDAFADTGTYTLALSGAGKRPWRPLTQAVVVEPRPYNTQYITIPEDKAHLLAPEIRAGEDALLETIYTQFTPEQQWQDVFQYPVTSTIVTAVYGDSRSYNEGPIEIFHTGIDFAGGIGTPILAPAAGVVVFSDEMALHGNTLVLDHGLGVMTAYFHLSEPSVNVGDRVAASQQIGLGGNTGLSEGAHLHWDVRVNGVAVDGLPWLTQPFP